MNEVYTYQNAKKRIELLCAELDLTCVFFCDESPLRMVIKPYRGMGSQLSLLENLDARGMAPNAELTMTYDRGAVEYSFLQRFSIAEANLTKLKKVL